jgi:hypothetical protein
LRLGLGSRTEEDRRIRRTAALVLTTLAVSLGAGDAAWAITVGQVDGDAHPNVAIIVFYQPDGRFRCSATLVSPTVLVTAAHCTEASAAR